jgi:hypothetical protein
MERFVKQLSVLPKNVAVPWDDRRIGAGARWKEEIEAAMEEAAVAVLLVSAEFFNSQFIMPIEVPLLLEREKAKRLRIVPVIISPCFWRGQPWLAELQARPRNGKTLAEFKPVQAEKEMANIVEEIAKMLLEAELVIPPSAAVPAQAREPAPEGASPPSVERGEAKPDEEPVAGDAATQDARQAQHTVEEITPLVEVPATKPVLEEFQRDFQGAARLIEVIGTYKQLHDDLQRFERQGFSDLARVYKRLEIDPEAVETLQASAAELLALVYQGRALANRFSEPPPGERLADAEPELEWIERLEQAHGFLVKACDTLSIGLSATALQFITRVLDREPPRLDRQMFIYTGRLNFEPVERALEVLRQRVAAAGLKPETERDIREGIDALARIDAHFRSLMAQHHTWQAIDGELRIIEASVAETLAPLMALWSALKAKVEPFFRESEEAWACELRETARKLDAAFEPAAEPRSPQADADLRRLFLRFRRICRDHFFFVDTTVRHECAQLARIGARLELLNRRIETDRS